MMRQTLARSLELEPQFQVVGQAENGQDLLQIIAEQQPDVILLDIEMPVMDGFAVLDELYTRDDSPRVLVLSMHFDDNIVKDVINRGARGMLPKNADFETLLNAIEEVMASGYYFSKKINLVLIQDMMARQKVRPSFGSPKLTYQEARLLDLICEDRMNKEIAEIMEVSPRTLERYKTSLYEKTKAKTIVGLVLFAIKHNYFSPQRLHPN